MIEAGIHRFISLSAQPGFFQNVKYASPLAAAGGPACYLCGAMCIRLEKFRIYWTQFPAGKKKIVHLYSAQQTQKKEKVEIMQYASGAAPSGPGFLLD